MSHRFIARFVTLAMAVAMPFACAQDTTMPDQQADLAAFDTGLVTLDWQAQARSLVGANRMNSLAGGRVYAAVSLAQHRALKAADNAVPATRQTDAFGPGGRARYEARRGAIAAASARVLSYLFPAAATSLDQLVAEQGTNAPGQTHPEFTRGVAIGQAAGDALVEHLKNDGFTKPWTGTVPTGPGMWIPTTLPPGGGTLGAVTPYFMSNGSQFRPAPPPAFGSAAFNTDLAEVVTLAKNRTPAETQFARDWDFGAGTPTTPGFWNTTAVSYIEQGGLDERSATEVLAMMHTAVFDALIGCWEAKYYYWMLRPSHADPSIPLAFTLPNFPAYPSGHSCASASAGRVLTHYFPQKETELNQLVSNAGLSRILAGIHYRFDVTAGQALGRAVAEFAITRGLN